MFRVVRVKNGYNPYRSSTDLKIGSIYTVIGTLDAKGSNDGEGHAIKDGLYYNILEDNLWHHSDLFIRINEDEQDETEMHREHTKVKS